MSEKRKEQGRGEVRGGEGGEKETVNAERTKQTQRNEKITVGFQLSHTGAQNQDSRPPFPRLRLQRSTAVETGPRRSCGGQVGGVWMAEQDLRGGRGVTKDR